MKIKMLVQVAAFEEMDGMTGGASKAGAGVAFFPEGSISTVLAGFASILSKYTEQSGKDGESAVSLLITDPGKTKGSTSKEKEDEKQQGVPVQAPVQAGGVSVHNFPLPEDVSAGSIHLGPAVSVSVAGVCSPSAGESDLFTLHGLPVCTGAGAFLPLFAGELEEGNGLVAPVSGERGEGRAACIPAGVEGLFGFSAGSAGAAPEGPVAVVERATPAATFFPGGAKKDDVSAPFSPSFSGDGVATQEISIVDNQATFLAAGKPSGWAGNTAVKPGDVLTGFGVISQPAAGQFSPAAEFSGGKGGADGRGTDLLPASSSGFSGSGPETRLFPATGSEAVSGGPVEAPWKKPREEGLEDIFRNMSAFSREGKASSPLCRSDAGRQFWPARAADEPGGLPSEGRDVILAASGLPEQSRPFDEGMAITGTGFLGSFSQTSTGRFIPVDLSHLAAAISQMVLQPQQRQAVLRVKLIPEHLGELTVHLAMVGKKLTVTFSVAEQETREVLAGNLAQLQHHLLHLDHRLEDVILQVDKGIANGLPSSLAEGRNPKEEGGGGWEHPDRSGTLFGEESGRNGIVESRQDRFGLGVPAWLNILV